MKLPLLVCLTLALGLCGSGCRRAEVSGPPTLHPGRDECALCGMIVNEERFACALLVALGGAPTHLVFDDAGCMLDYRSGHPDLIVIGGFVHDHGTRRWLGADRARYVLASAGKVATPMGSGIVAYESPEAAAIQAREWGGADLDYDGLAGARREWNAARARSPSGSS